MRRRAALVPVIVVLSIVGHHGASGDGQPRLARAVRSAHDLPPGQSTTSASATHSGPRVARADRVRHPARAGLSPATVLPPGTPPAVPGSRTLTAPVPAPSATGATAHFLYADFLGTCVACTSAQAGPRRSGGEARGTRVASEPLSEGQAPANGYSSGSLVSLPASPLLGLALVQWQTRSGASDSASMAHAETQLLDLFLLDPALLHVSAGASRSDARSTAGGSEASSASDAASIGTGAGALSVVLLHSGSSSAGTGHTYLARVNSGSALLESRDAATSCSLVVSRVACLRVLHGDRDGAEIGSAQDGRSQSVIGLVTSWSGGSDSPEPLR
jgi:hypothetical protein